MIQYGREGRGGRGEEISKVRVRLKKKKCKNTTLLLLQNIFDDIIDYEYY